MDLLLVLALFILLFDASVAWVVMAVLLLVAVSRASAWLVTWIVMVGSSIGLFVMISWVVAVLAVVIQLSPAVAVPLLTLAPVFFIFLQDLLADAVQSFNVLDQFDDFIAISKFPAILLDEFEPCHARYLFVECFLGDI